MDNKDYEKIAVGLLLTAAVIIVLAVCLFGWAIIEFVNWFTAK